MQKHSSGIKLKLSLSTIIIILVCLTVTTSTYNYFLHRIIHSNHTEQQLLPRQQYQDDNNIQYNLARSESFGFFYDITSEHWNLYKKAFLQHEDHRFPDKPLTYHPEVTDANDARPEVYKNRESQWKGWFSYPAWYQNNFEPNFSCPFEKRVGNPMNGDGGKWICDPHRIAKIAASRKTKDPNHPGCVVYSVGSNGDFTFETGLEKEVGEGVCEFHIFDFGGYGYKMKQSGLKRAFYHEWGLEKQKPNTQSPPVPSKRMINGKQAQFYGLHDTIKLLGHAKLDVIDIFKIDCESCEWETYNDWLSSEIPILHQIQVEVHKAPKEVAINFFTSLETAGYLRFHKEPNIQWGPSCIEYAFLKVDKTFVDGKRKQSVYS